MLFAVTIYVPVYVQGAQGESATASGVALIPLLLTWTDDELRVRADHLPHRPLPGVPDRRERDRPRRRDPAAGLDADSSRLEVAIAVAVVGAGMGTMVQTYIIATQNAVDTSVVGTATAALQFFRSMGGSLAVAGLGALLATRLSSELCRAARRRGVARIDQDRLLEGSAAIPAALVRARGTRWRRRCTACSSRSSRSRRWGWCSRCGWRSGRCGRESA